MACGKPIIAFAKGGATETVIDSQTGVFFHQRTADDLDRAIKKLARLRLDPQKIREHSMQFGKENFVTTIGKYIQTKVTEYFNHQRKIL